MINICKLLAMILCFTTCSCIGIYKAGQLRQRKLLLEEFQDLLQTISTEMGYFKEPLPVIFQRICDRSFNINEQKSVAVLLRQCMLQEDKSFDQIWKQAIIVAYVNEPLNASDIRIMQKCGSFLGQSSFDGQKGHFTLVQEELNRQIIEADQNMKIKGALYSKAGVSIGAVMIIVLI